MFDYIKKTYNVPAELGREILFENKRKGVIVADEGHYIGVNFYDSKPGVISSLHPTSEIEYLETFGVIRKPTRSQQRYRDYLDADSGLTFIEWIKSRY